MSQRNLYQHILLCPMSKEQRKLSKDVRNNKLGSYKAESDDTARLLRRFPR